MFRTVPRAPLILGLAGLLPFLWGALAALVADPAALPLMGDMPRALRGERLLVEYGAIILVFMAGALWGFAARAGGRAAVPGLIASVLPALYVLFLAGRGLEADLLTLAFGFAVLLVLDWAFQRAGLAPRWWLALRVPLTLVVLLALLLPVAL